MIQSHYDQHIIIRGIFNVILKLSKKSGGISPPLKTIQDFSKFLEDSNLMDIEPSSGSFSWTNKREIFSQIAVRFDQFLISQNLKLTNSTFLLDIMPKPGSNNFPISIQVSFNTRN